MCSRFIEDFANKVIEKSCCESCGEIKQLCKGPKNFNYLNKTICMFITDIYTLDYKFINLYTDAILSCLHNRLYAQFFSFLDKIRDNSKLMNILKEKIKSHINCIDDTDLVLKARRVWEDMQSFYVVYDNSGEKSFKDWLLTNSKLLDPLFLGAY